ncbi:MAG: hypothetical protein AAGD25_13615 [Cyanobacteria bacterium P01_F01_bin.150]
MPILVDSGFALLHSQHTLQHADWLTIYAFIEDENISKHLDSYSFEDFLEFTVYLFTTTQSQSTRRCIAQIMPKFGSAVVLPILKVLCNQDASIDQTAQILAWQSLSEMTPYSLTIGLNQVLESDIQKDLRATALQVLKQLLQSCESSIQQVLYQLLSVNSLMLVSANSGIQWPVHAQTVVMHNQRKRDANNGLSEGKTIQYA